MEYTHVDTECAALIYTEVPVSQPTNSYHSQWKFTLSTTQCSNLLNNNITATLAQFSLMSSLTPSSLAFLAHHHGHSGPHTPSSPHSLTNICPSDEGKERKGGEEGEEEGRRGKKSRCGFYKTSNLVWMSTCTVRSKSDARSQGTQVNSFKQVL